MKAEMFPTVTFIFLGLSPGGRINWKESHRGLQEFVNLCKSSPFGV